MLWGSDVTETVGHGLKRLTAAANAEFDVSDPLLEGSIPWDLITSMAAGL
jgi:hypothetical protein